MKATKATDKPPQVNEMSPKNLRTRINGQEQRLSDDAFERLEIEFANLRFFNYPLFSPKGVSDESRKWLSDPGNKYLYLLLLLKASPSREDRLWILANWLSQEGVCQPKDLLGKDYAQYQRRALRGPRGRLSFTQLRLAWIVDEWKPYFEQLLRARRKGLDLRRLGFEESAIRSAIRKRSAIAAACEYIASGSRRDSHALANAHSRFLGIGNK
jgi:hypothetical protein